MKRLLPLLIGVFTIPIISIPSKAHTAFDKKKLKDFYSWVSCEKQKYLNNSKELSCIFPKNPGEHRDSLTVFCEEKEISPVWEKQWMEKYGNVKVWELPPEAFDVYPAYTVFMYSYHDMSKSTDLIELFRNSGKPRIF